MKTKHRNRKVKWLPIRYDQSEKKTITKQTKKKKKKKKKKKDKQKKEKNNNKNQKKPKKKPNKQTKKKNVFPNDGERKVSIRTSLPR